VIQVFLTAGLVDEITIGIAPVLIGNGIPLFGELPATSGYASALLMPRREA
jgi:riboflavin biosynthesis pyrimidine reductase